VRKWDCLCWCAWESVAIVVEGVLERVLEGVLGGGVGTWRGEGGSAWRAIARIGRGEDWLCLSVTSASNRVGQDSAEVSARQKINSSVRVHSIISAALPSGLLCFDCATFELFLLQVTRLSACLASPRLPMQSIPPIQSMPSVPSVQYASLDRPHTRSRGLEYQRHDVVSVRPFHQSMVSESSTDPPAAPPMPVTCDGNVK
jgi:hypothetical protein